MQGTKSANEAVFCLLGRPHLFPGSCCTKATLRGVSWTLGLIGQACHDEVERYGGLREEPLAVPPHRVVRALIMHDIHDLLLAGGASSVSSCVPLILLQASTGGYEVMNSICQDYGAVRLLVAMLALFVLCRNLLVVYITPRPSTATGRWLCCLCGFGSFPNGGSECVAESLFAAPGYILPCQQKRSSLACE